MAKYRVTSAIKFKGKIRDEGEIVEMSGEEARGLHVEPVASAQAPAAKPDDDKGGKK